MPTLEAFVRNANVLVAQTVAATPAVTSAPVEVVSAVTAWDVFFYTLPMALVSGFGALPFLFVKDISKRSLGLCNAIAAGVMLAASFCLIYEGVYIREGKEQCRFRLVSGILLGLLFIIVSQKAVEGKDIHVGSLNGLNAKKAFMIIAIMTLHAFSEGLGVGVSFGGSQGELHGKFITAAIALHNIPEALAISLVVIPRGETVWRSVLWNIFSSLPQPLVAVPAFMFVEAFEQILPFGLGVAAGTMLWMVFAEILPDALEEASPSAVGTTVTLATTCMIFVEMTLKES